MSFIIKKLFALLLLVGLVQALAAKVPGRNRSFQLNA
jgi:hypothetical protein